MASRATNHILNFDIDAFLNPYIPRNRLDLFPRPLAHFLGHRDHTPKEPHHLISWILTFFATIAGLCLVGGVYNYAPLIAQWNPPALVASLGASAVLDYNSIRSPLAQPRNTILGHTLSAIVAVGISKGFQQSAAFEEINWVAGAIACATANLLMSITNTVHPPGGATAILACVSPQVVAMGWMFVPIIFLASVLMSIVACLFNNTLRWYPVYWWTAAEVGQAYQSRDLNAEKKEREEKGEQKQDLEKSQTKGTHHSDRTLGHDQGKDLEGEHQIRVGPYGISMPTAFHIELTHEEEEFLGGMKERLRLALQG